MDTEIKDGFNSSTMGYILFLTFYDETGLNTATLL